MGRYADFTTKPHCPLGRILKQPLTGQLSGQKTQELSERASGPAGCSTRHALGPTPNAVDLPHLSGEGDEVRGVPDELERGRPVQTVHDDGECAVPVDLDERAGVRHRITRVNIRVDRAVREGVETAAAKFHVKEEGDAGGYLRSGGRSRPERHNLAGLGAGGGRGRPRPCTPYCLSPPARSGRCCRTQ